VIDEVRNGPSLPDAAAGSFPERVRVGDIEQVAARQASIFRTRFQQLTGPLMARSVEHIVHQALLSTFRLGAHPARVLAPCKCLGYRTPAEVFRKKLLAQNRHAG
jgi:(1->4)-alpha-D-glucan 1-alpha-D-glucosylmutase